jgi:hypothetical protein
VAPAPGGAGGAGSERRAEGAIDIQIKLKQAPVPGGLDRLLTMMAQKASIQPADEE